MIDRSRLRRGLVGIVAAVAALGLGAARATPFGAEGAGLLLENTILDLDFNLLTQFVGAFPLQALNYGADISPTSFTAFLSGGYAGRSLNVNYSGNLSAFPGGAVTWIGTGAYGADSWSSSGSASFSFPTPSTFAETYSASLAVGTNSGSYALALAGIDDPTVTYTDGSGTAIANGVVVPGIPTASDPDNPRPGDPTVDDVCYGALRGGKCIGREEILSADAVASTSPDIVDTGIMAVVPEPATLPLLAAAFGAFAALTGIRGRGQSR